MCTQFHLWRSSEGWNADLGRYVLYLFQTLCCGCVFCRFCFFQSLRLRGSIFIIPLPRVLLFFLGQLATVTAIRVADVTVQGPMMGIKIVFVATLAIAFGAGEVTTRWWIAAFLAAGAIFVLGCSGFKKQKATYLGAFFALTASLFFATEDVLVQMWAADYGPMKFIVIMMSTLAALSVFLIPLFRWRLRDMPKTAWHWMLGGAFLMGVQGILFTVPIAVNGDATVVNILYSSRGIWSIILVVTVGKLFHNKESSAGTSVMVQRFIGAMMLFMAIVIVLTENH